MAQSYDQRHFRFGNDDGTADPATWAAAQDTNISSPLDTNIRLRLVISETIGGVGLPPNGNIQLQYSKNGGAYTNVSGASSNVRAALSAQFADGASVTRKLTQFGSNSFVDGKADENDGISASVSFSLGTDTECEFCFQLRSADGVVNGDTFDFKLIVNGNPLNAYSAVPRVTASVAGTKAPPPVRQRTRFFRRR